MEISIVSSCHQTLTCQKESHDFDALLLELKSCGKQRDLERGRSLHADILKRDSFVGDVRLSNTLISMYGKCGALEDARAMFEKFSARNIVSWNALISGYIAHGKNDNVLECFRWMQAKGVCPNAVTFICILKACGNLGLIELVESTYLQVSKLGFLERFIMLGTTLVDVYCRCGMLREAQAVFDNLPSPNIAAWNTLIGGYAYHELADEAIDSFEQMQTAGILPDSITFICMLKLCAGMKFLEFGGEIHAMVEERGFLGKDVALGTALVDMYAKCAMLGKAQEVFDKIPMHDVVSWSALISGYVQHGLFDEALNCFRKMQDGGFSPNVVTFISILKACASMGSLKMGEEIHAEVRKQGLLNKDIMLGTAIINMYAKCGKMEKAQELFNELPMQDVASWSAMIAGYSQNGLNNEALNCFRKMQDDGFSPDVVTFVCVLEACGNLRSREMGEEIHSEVKKRGLLGINVFLDNALVDMYVKCGVLAKAQQMFDEHPTRDLVSWNVLISGYAENGCYDEILNCFKRMQDEGFMPNAATLIGMLRAYRTFGFIKIGDKIHLKIFIQEQLKTDIMIGVAMVDVHSKCGMMRKAQEIFDCIPHRNTALWNALIGGYADHGCIDLTLECFKRMQDEGTLPDSVTFVCILKTCGNVGALEMGEEIHARLHKQGLLEDNTILGTTLVDMYAKCNMLQKAKGVFNDISEKTVLSWNVLINGYTQHGYGDEAVNCFRKMQDECLHVNHSTLVCVLKACGIIGYLEMGEKIHAEVKKKGMLEGDIVLGNALMSMYANCGVLRKAIDVFDELQMQDIASWNGIITAYTQLGQTELAFDSFGKMLAECMDPDEITFLVLLNNCNHEGLVEEGSKLFDNLETVWNVLPTLEHYACMVDLFGRSGDFRKALALIGHVPFSNRLQLWLCILSSCCKWVNVQLGRWAFEQSVQLDENCTAAYVCMGNLFASAGMHAEAKEIENLRLTSIHKRQYK